MVECRSRSCRTYGVESQHYFANPIWSCLSRSHEIFSQAPTVCSDARIRHTSKSSCDNVRLWHFCLRSCDAEMYWSFQSNCHQCLPTYLHVWHPGRNVERLGSSSSCLARVRLVDMAIRAYSTLRSFGRSLSNRGCSKVMQLSSITLLVPRTNSL